ncbi:hypothetical protein ACVWXS_002614 [Lysinibacillus sp. TE18511]
MNPNVASASDRSIQYQPAFKIKAVKENLAGKGPAQIFTESDFYKCQLIYVQKRSLNCV